MTELPQDHTRVLDALKKWGYHTTSFQILEPGYQYWFDETTQGVIAWVQCKRYRVVAGPPIGPIERRGEIANRFIEEAVNSDQQVLFFQTDTAFIEQLRKASAKRLCDAIPIGEQPNWEPALYTTEGVERKTLRAQLNRAKNKGVKVRAVTAHELTEAPGPLRAQIEVVLRRWLDARQMSPMVFLVDLKPFHLSHERRYYVAEHYGHAVGFLAAVPVYAKKGWFFEDVIRVPDAPNGTVELLLDAAMRDAASQGDQYATLGLSPLANIPETSHSHQRLTRALRWCYETLGPLYRFTGIRAFKARLHPNQWESQYLVQSPGRIGLGSFHAVLRAFAGGGLVAFGLHTLQRWLAALSFRGWAIIMAVLAALLVPWTLLLATADGEYWFGDRSIQLGWVAFDTLMVILLTGLSWLLQKRHTAARPTAIFLAGATLTDLVVTTAQAFNLHHGVTGVTALFVAAGISGPFIATVLLALLAWALPTMQTTDTPPPDEP